MIALARLVIVLAAAPPAPICLPARATSGLGTPDPFRAPAAQATELNAAGTALYRQGKWDDARARYRAALTVDPGFLAPRLNVACSLVRQDRFAEAAAETRALLEQAYVPWAREVLEAADLGALKVRPEMADIRRTLAEAGARWGEGLEDSVIFVARQRTPLRIPEKGEGVFILNPHQEAYAFAPSTGLFRQLTAEDGHVVVLARTPNRRGFVYATAEKLVRGPGAGEVWLRGVTLRELELATMSASPALPIEGNVRRLEIVSTSSGLAYRIESDGLDPIDGVKVVKSMNGWFVRGDLGVLLPWSHRVHALKTLAVLTARGAASAPATATGGNCPVTATDAGAPGGTRTVVVTRSGRPPRRIGDRFGAGLTGLPLP